MKIKIPWQTNCHKKMQILSLQFRHKTNNTFSEIEQHEDNDPISEKQSDEDEDPDMERQSQGNTNPIAEIQVICKHKQQIPKKIACEKERNYFTDSEQDIQQLGAMRRQNAYIHVTVAANPSSNLQISGVM